LRSGLVPFRHILVSTHAEGELLAVAVHTQIGVAPYDGEAALVGETCALACLAEKLATGGGGKCLLALADEYCHLITVGYTSGSENMVIKPQTMALILPKSFFENTFFILHCFLLLITFFLQR